MSITDELREWFKDRLFMGNGYAELTAIADRIDAEHEGACGEAYGNGVMSVPIALDESAWVRLPVDADGEPIHVGDVVVAQLLFGGESKPLVVDRMELSRGRDGDLWCVALDNDKECWNMPSILRHHRPPTVEGILRDFGVDIAHALDADPDATVPEAIIAEYAKRLRIAGDAE